jgi:hypothetical protein
MTLPPGADPRAGVVECGFIQHVPTPTIHGRDGPLRRMVGATLRSPRDLPVKRIPLERHTTLHSLHLLHLLSIA